MGVVPWTVGKGPLVRFAEGFREELLRHGHPTTSVKHPMLLMGRLNRWMADEGLDAGDLTRSQVERFIGSGRAGGDSRVPTFASFASLIAYLVALGVVAVEEPDPPTGRDEFLARYHDHLVDDRGLTPTTVHRYESFARRFLATRAASTGAAIGIEGITAVDVHVHMLEAGDRLSAESAKREVADLRALLRFCYLDGLVPIDLGDAMPPMAAWRGTRLVPTMTSADVAALLASCDRSTLSGRRDRAVLALLARLGLRSGEVAALALDDVD